MPILEPATVGGVQIRQPTYLDPERYTALPLLDEAEDEMGPPAKPQVKDRLLNETTMTFTDSIGWVIEVRPGQCKLWIENGEIEFQPHDLNHLISTLQFLRSRADGQQMHPW